MEIKRDFYLDKLIRYREVPLIKIITGVRRCGKSYLLDPIFRTWLIQHGVPEDHIIHLNLELDENASLRDHTALRLYIAERTPGAKAVPQSAHFQDPARDYYVLLDEIQLVDGFESVLASFLNDGLQVYVTGSNSRFLSSDIITEFRGRSIDVHMFPLSFSEFSTAYADRQQAWQDYLYYGGLPLILSFPEPKEKMDYLLGVQRNIYLKDVLERYHIRNDSVIKSLIEVVASSTGSLTNPYKLENAFKSKVGERVGHNTIDGYLAKLQEAFIIEKAQRYDVKGKQYIDTPFKYYFTDPGIRNSFLGFRQLDEGHMMENIVYNELRRRGYQVDIGVVSVKGKNNQSQYEVDFVANLGNQRCYLQCALHANTTETQEREMRSLRPIGDSFKKIILTNDSSLPWYNDDGVFTMNVLDFLLDENSLA